jgi:ketosteroid isomerase-like protein
MATKADIEGQSPSTAAEVLKQTMPAMLRGDIEDLLGSCTEDVVFEFPFAPADRPRRVEGHDAIRAYLQPIFGRMQIQKITSLEVHQSVDPSVAIIEFTMRVEVGDGSTRELSYIDILTVRDGRIASFRDYWNPLALADQQGGGES